MFLAISLSAFSADLTMGSSWAVCQDIGRRYAAIVAGFMNMVGNLGGAIGPLLSGYVLDRYLRLAADGSGVAVEQLSSAARNAALMEGYRTNFWIFAGTFAIGVILLDPDRLDPARGRRVGSPGKSLIEAVNVVM